MTFGLWTVLCRSQEDPRRWLVQCQCGYIAARIKALLVSGKSTGCGGRDLEGWPRDVEDCNTRHANPAISGEEEANALRARQRKDAKIAWHNAVVAVVEKGLVSGEVAAAILSVSAVPGAHCAAPVSVRAEPLRGPGTGRHIDYSYLFENRPNCPSQG